MQLKLILTVILFICTNITVLAQEDKQEEVKTTVENKKDSKIDSEKEKNVTIPLPVSVEQQHKEDLTHYLPTNRVAPILAGPDDYLTLIDENTSVNNKGVAILLPDWQQGAVNPKAINFLRKTLPKQGWTTISIQPANKPSNFPSRALKVSEQQEANKTIIDDYKTKLAALINAVLNKSKEYPGIVIIIAQGNHGAMLVDIFDQQSTNQNGTTPNALILLSSYLLNSNELIDRTNTAFAKTLAYSEYPILDLYLKYDNAIVLDKAAQRLTMANQELKAYYRQRQINNNAVGYYPEQELLVQINSWLKSIGW
ncbi:DUF3530 family protein [Candidatus Colwellia aromaticivorans]|uniref:DUF3530 family protein n=1 Tax=Candidatus Colwellia aromaticivorans TaxID=2267621 RepID=UPI000DF27CD8|nr:DUF3530 family protein [Candidatus Colwellia aromaticivorans]